MGGGTPLARRLESGRGEMPVLGQWSELVAQGTETVALHQLRVDDVVLMASELFTNAVLHGDGDVEVVLSLSGGHVRLEVADGGGVPVPSEVPRPTPDAITGRGLAIVDALADRWGNGSDPAGRTRVWIEIPRR